MPAAQAARDGEILELWIVRIDRLDAGNGTDVARAALVQGNRAAVERQRAAWRG